MIHFISDTHFNDDRTFPFDQVVFRNKSWSKKDLDEYQIYNWNNDVLPTDTVYHVGDFGKFETYEELCRFVSSLCGNKVLVLGNHDIELALNIMGGSSNTNISEVQKFWLDAGFSEVYSKPTFINKFMSLSHEPPQFVHAPYVRVFGHVHTSMLYRTITPASACVCACRWGFAPVSSDTLKSKMDECRRRLFESTNMFEYFPDDVK